MHARASCVPADAPHGVDPYAPDAFGSLYESIAGCGSDAAQRNTVDGFATPACASRADGGGESDHECYVTVHHSVASDTYNVRRATTADRVEGRGGGGDPTLDAMTKQRRYSVWTSPRKWASERVGAVAAWMSLAASLYWAAMLVPSLAVFALTSEIANHPGDGPYTVKALLSIARGAAFPAGFLITLWAPARRAVTGSPWRRLLALALLPLMYSAMPNAAFGLVRHEVPFLLGARFVGTLAISAAFCAYLACVQGRRASDITMPVVTLAMLLSPAISRPFAHNMALVLGDAHIDWMPLSVSVLCLAPVMLAACALVAAPPPTDADAAARLPRPPSTRAADRAWLARYWAPLSGLALCNTALQAMGAVRDAFTADLLGEDAPWWHSVLADAPACVGACLAYMLLLGVNNNRNVFLSINAAGVVCGTVVALSGAALLWGAVSPLAFLIVSGVGYFAALVPFSGGGIVFERLVASTRTPVDGVLVNIVCQVPAYAGALGVLFAVPAMPRAESFFAWTSLVGGGALAASFAWALLAGHLTLPSAFPISLARRNSMAYMPVHSGGDGASARSTLLCGDQDGIVGRSGSCNDNDGYDYYSAGIPCVRSYNAAADTDVGLPGDV